MNHESLVPVSEREDRRGSEGAPVPTRARKKLPALDPEVRAAPVLGWLGAG
jgi:hypothetical protein